MSVNKRIFSRVSDDFKIRQLNNEVDCKNRRERLYRELPRLEEIDDEIASAGLSLVRLALDPDRDITAEINALRNKNEALKEEKTRILLEAGYSEHEFEMSYKCPACKDSGFIDNEMCSCFKKQLISAAYEVSNLSSVLKGQSFENFDNTLYSKNNVDPDTGFSSYDTMLMAYNIALDFVSGFDKNGKSLLFYGKPGLGKTYLSTCIAKGLLDSGRSVIYQSSGKVFQLLEEYKFGRSENIEAAKEKIDMLYYADLLILDDLGTEFVTSYTNAAFFDIVNTRLMEGKKTIISTNYSFTDLEKIYSERIASRILGNYMPVKFFGEDIRVKTM